MMINMIFLYYDNPQMLQLQIECWNSYEGALREMLEIILIDDGSPKTFASDVVRRQKCKIPIRVYRIQEDIPWNFAGARNLGCSEAEDWIYISDIDTILLAEDARLLFESHTLEAQKFYLPNRVWLPNMRQASIALVNLLFHKEKYLEIGGYDEDYAGNYGREETDFYNRLKRVATKINREDVVIRAVPPSLVADSRTITQRPRDKTRNAEIYERKLAAGFPKPVNPLRFTWERVL